MYGTKKGIEGRVKRGLDSKKWKRKRKGTGDFLISRDNYEWRGFFFAFFPKPQPHLMHRERERDEEEEKKEEEEEEYIKVFDFEINSR